MAGAPRLYSTLREGARRYVAGREYTHQNERRLLGIDRRSAKLKVQLLLTEARRHGTTHKGSTDMEYVIEVLVHLVLQFLVR